MRLFPKRTTNRNVPKDVFLVAEVTKMSGEVKITYYIERDGWPSYVHDWVTDRPCTINFLALSRLISKTPNELDKRFKAWKEGRQL